MEFKVNFKFTCIKQRLMGLFSSFFYCERSVKLHVIYKLLQILDFCMTSSPHKCLVGERRIAGVFSFPMVQLPQLHVPWLSALAP